MIHGYISYANRHKPKTRCDIEGGIPQLEIPDVCIPGNEHLFYGYLNDFCSNMGYSFYSSLCSYSNSFGGKEELFDTFMSIILLFAPEGIYASAIESFRDASYDFTQQPSKTMIINLPTDEFCWITLIGGVGLHIEESVYLAHEYTCPITSDCKDGDGSDGSDGSEGSEGSEGSDESDDNQHKCEKTKCQICDGCTNATLATCVECSCDLRATISLSKSEVTLCEEYTIAVKLNKRTNVAKVEFYMQRKTAINDWHKVKESTSMEMIRRAISPGNWDIKAEIHAGSTVIETENISVVEEFPSYFEIIESDRVNAKFAELWENSKNFAADFQDTKQVQEFGCYVEIDPSKNSDNKFSFTTNGVTSVPFALNEDINNNLVPMITFASPCETRENNPTISK